MSYDKTILRIWLAKSSPLYIASYSLNRQIKAVNNVNVTLEDIRCSRDYEFSIY